MKYGNEETGTHGKALLTVTCSPFPARPKWVVVVPLVSITTALCHHVLINALSSLAAPNLQMQLASSQVTRDKVFALATVSH